MESRYTEESNYFKVSEVKRNRYYRLIKLQGASNWVTLPLSACIKTGDLARSENGSIWVKCVNGEAQIAPPFCSKYSVSKGALKLELLIKEITDKKEYESYSRLRNLHYRSNKIWGKSARLIIRNFHPLYPEVIGYVELGTTFYMNKPRSKILDSYFSFKDIKWEHWDMQTTRKNINLIVRIARIVVLPEFRGLGIGQLLVKGAMDFARSHWQVAGLKPYFIEISADMLRYVPFAKHAGMLFIGETEGNLKRLWKDMEYLIRNSERIRNREIVKVESNGIVDQQVSRMKRTLKLMDDRGMGFEEVISKLKDLTVKKVLKNYDLFYQVISLPKPTYMAGLYPETHSYLQDRLSENPVTMYEVISLKSIQKLSGQLRFSKLTVHFDSKVRRTMKTHTVQQAFGISPTKIRTNTLDKLTLKVKPGEIVLITGPSGSGKTTLLNAIRNGCKDQKNAIVEGEIIYPPNYDPGSFRPIRSSKALIELFKNLDVSTTLYLMGIVGLSDAFVLLKRFDELSKGQQYRLMMALLIANRKNTWIFDEFCSNLDYATSMTVADGLQRLARRMGATVVVAASNHETFIESLKPDTVVSLSSTGDIKAEDGAKFIEKIHFSKNTIFVPVLNALNTELNKTVEVE